MWCQFKSINHFMQDWSVWLRRSGVFWSKTIFCVQKSQTGTLIYCYSRNQGNLIDYEHFELLRITVHYHDLLWITFAEVNKLLPLGYGLLHGLIWNDHAKKSWDKRWPQGSCWSQSKCVKSSTLWVVWVWKGKFSLYGFTPGNGLVLDPVKRLRPGRYIHDKNCL